MEHDAGSLLRRLAFPASLMAAAVLFAATAVQPLHLDNVDFPAAAAAAARTGLPVYYRGEFTPALSGLFHPPLYIYSLAAWFRAFGEGPVQARAFGFVCALLLGWIWLEIWRTLAGRRAGGAGVWFWPLFLLNPYTLQGASITDIDTTVYGPLLAGVLLASLRMGWREGVPRSEAVRPREWALLAALMALALWAKLTTVWAVLPAAALLLAPRLGVRKAMLGTAAAALSAIALFLVTYALYGWLTGLDAWYSVRFTIESFLIRGTNASQGVAGRLIAYGSNLQFMAPFHARWTGVLPWILAAAAAAAAFRRVRREASPRDRALGVLLALALGVTVYYCAHTPTYGLAPFKYVYVFWPAAVLCVADFMERAFQTAASGSGAKVRRLEVAAACVWLAGTAATLVWAGDRLLYENRMLWPQSLALWIPAAAAALAVFFNKHAWAAAALVAAVAASGGFSLGVAAAQAKARYSTTYDYGQEGLAETACYLRTHTEPGDRLVCMKDVGYLAERRYYSTYSAIQGVPEYMNAILRVLESGEARYAVFTEGRGQDNLALNPRLQAGVEQFCRLERSIGHYRIYACGGSEKGPPVNARRR